MFCQNCGATIGDNETVCPQCYSSVEAPAKTEESTYNNAETQVIEPNQQPQYVEPQQPQYVEPQQPQYVEPQQPQYVEPQQPQYGEQPYQAAPIQEKKPINDIVWGALGFCVPLAGVILFFMWKNDKPKSSKTAGIGALISIGLGLIATIIWTIILVISIAASAGGMM